MVFKRKQIVVLSLIIMIVIAGFLQYSYNNAASSGDKETGNPGEAVYVGNNDVNSEGEGKQTTSTASKSANDYFTQTRLNKEIMNERNTERLRLITEDENASPEVKTQAYNQMMKIIEMAEKESRIEALIKEKGFEDIIVLFGEENNVDVIVKIPYLTSADVAQIADIVTRQTNIPLTGVNVSNIY